MTVTFVRLSKQCTHRQWVYQRMRRRLCAKRDWFRHPSTRKPPNFGTSEPSWSWRNNCWSAPIVTWPRMWYFSLAMGCRFPLWRPVGCTSDRCMVTPVKKRNYPSKSSQTSAWWRWAQFRRTYLLALTFAQNLSFAFLVHSIWLCLLNEFDRRERQSTIPRGTFFSCLSVQLWGSRNF